MNLSINENIKKLRKDKNITQEKLAEHLSVSIQAVSKWERGETFPDITMILPIASYFNVSTDELLGVDAAREAEKKQAYWDKYMELSHQGKQAEMNELVVKAYKEFPNDFWVMHFYTQYLTCGRGNDKSVDEKVLERADEAEALCERILEECNIDGIRYEAIGAMSRIHKARGNVDKALESLAVLPNWFSTQGQLSEQLFPKDCEEWRYWLNKNFNELCDFAHNKLLKRIWFFDGSFEEKISATLRVADYLLKILEDTGYEPLYRLIWHTYAEIGRQHRFAEKHGEIAKYYDMGFEYAVKSAHNAGAVKSSLTWLENNPWFEEARKHESFTAMLEKYKPFANGYEIKRGSKTIL